MVAAKLGDTVVEIRDLDHLLSVVNEACAENEPLVIDVGGGQEVVVNPAPRQTPTHVTRREDAGR